MDRAWVAAAIAAENNSLDFISLCLDFDRGRAVVDGNADPQKKKPPQVKHSDGFVIYVAVGT